MTLNLIIKAHVDNLSLSEIFELLSSYGKEKPKYGIMHFNGFVFGVKSEPTVTGINYTITELKKD